MPNPRGRPSTHTPEIAEEICERMMAGESLRAICKDPEMPAVSTVLLWALHDREGFSEQYAKAMDVRVEQMGLDILEIADETGLDTIYGENGERQNSEWINRSRLRVDTRKWVMSKMRPRKYGDKVGLEHSGGDGGPLTIRWENDSDPEPTGGD